MKNIFRKLISFALAGAMTFGTALSVSADFEYEDEPVAEDVYEDVDYSYYDWESWSGYYDEGIAIYHKDGSMTFCSGPKIAPYNSPEPFYAKELSSGRVLLQWERNSKASYFKLYKYDSKQGKYVTLKTVKKGTEDYECSYIITDNLKGETTYKFMLRGFDSKNKRIVNKTTSIKTAAAAPFVTVKHGSSSVSVSWKAQQSGATGCEVYVNTKPKKDGCYPTNQYFAYTADELKKDGYVLKSQSGKTASGSLKLKTTPCAVLVRTYKVVDGKKKYSGFSTAYNSDYIDSYVNTLKLSPKAVTSGEELELVKKYVNQVVKKDMSNYDKLKAIYTLVLTHGEYQSDYTKINGNRPVWQIMEKQEGQCAQWAYCLDAMLEYVGFDVKVARGLRPSGQQHVWCMIKIDGQWYNLDAHLGALLSPYKTDYIEYVVQEKY